MISLYALHDRFILHSEDYQQRYLQIYRQVDKIQVVEGSLDPQLVSRASSQYSYGIIGVIRLLAGQYLLHVTDAEVVSILLGYPIYKVISVGIIPFSTRRIQDDLPNDIARTEESLYIDMIRSVLTSSSFHFSYVFDLTNSIQRFSGFSPIRSEDNPFPDLITNADTRFFWNRHLLSELLSVPISPWTIVLVSGFVRSMHMTVNNTEFQYALVSRRSYLNAGKRFTRRGLDDQGHPTNFAEQEQIVSCKSAGSDSISVSSFVQTRGSIPLLWSQEACLKWAPPLRVSASNKSRTLLDKHLSHHASIYGRTVLLNLVNQCGNEAIMVAALSDCIPSYRSGSNHQYSLVSFDFHKKCKNMKYENISLLLDEVRDHVQEIGFFSGSVDQNGIWTVSQKQNGCFRTNCMDCLDRTNVVQSAIAKAILPRQLRCCNIVKDGMVEEFPSLYAGFREIWADNANAMSLLYSGTNALKTDYTRTGKRTILGACSDGKNSVQRFYLNNFQDGYNQDSLDLFLGNYKVREFTERSTHLPYARSDHQDGLPSLFNYLVSRSFLIFISTLLFTAAVPASVRPSVSSVFAFSMFVGPVISLAVAQKQGRRFVDKPKFLPFGTTLTHDLDDAKSQDSSSLKTK